VARGGRQGERAIGGKGRLNCLYSQVVIYRGLISGYTATLAGFGGKKRLDKMGKTEEYDLRFCYLRLSVWGEIYSQQGGRILSS
jgi:hypothetical protein